MKTRKINNNQSNKTKKNSNYQTKKIIFPTKETLFKFHKLMESYLLSLDLSFDQYDALKDYKGIIYEPINKYLWENYIDPLNFKHLKHKFGITLTMFEKFFTKKESLSKKIKEKIQDLVTHIDSIFKITNAKFPYSLIVYHGVNYYNYPENFFDYKIGDIIKYKGFMSTSLNPNTALKFNRCNYCCLYKIHIPKNSNIIPIPFLKFYNKKDKNIKVEKFIKFSFDSESPLRSEEEFLLNRNSNIKILDIYYMEPSAKTDFCSFKQIKNPSENKIKVFECKLIT